MRRWPLLVIALVGALVGAGGAVAIDRSAPDVVLRRVPSPTQTDAPAADGLLLVWTPGGLPAGLASGVRSIAGVNALTVVRGGTLLVPTSGGWSIPLDAIAIDPPTFAATAPAAARDTIMALTKPNTAVLGATSARLRGIGAGDALDATTAVVGIVDDAVIGGAELAMGTAGAERPWPERYLLVRYNGARGVLEQAVRRMLPTGAPVRFRAVGETPFLREGDAVLPQVLIKEHFGEFGYRSGPGRDITIDPAWVEANIVRATVPILGPVRCHRSLIAALTGAMTELRDEGLASLVDRSHYGGCWAPRLIAPGLGLSRHAWGAAIDLNVGRDAQDPRLVAIMRRWGFTYGGPWLRPDPVHFEYVRAPMR